MTDKEKIADTHAKIEMMFPMVQKMHDIVFLGNGKDSLVTQVSKNTDARKRIWPMTLACFVMVLTVAGRWLWDKIRGQG